MIQDILTHIEASNPCSLFSVAAWSQDQLDISPAGFIAAIETLASAGVISIDAEETSDGGTSLVVSLI